MTLTVIAQILVLIMGIASVLTVFADKEQTPVSLAVNILSIVVIVAILAGAPLLGFVLG